MKETSILNIDALESSGVLLVPAQMDGELFALFREALSGRKISLLFEAGALIDHAVNSALQGGGPLGRLTVSVPSPTKKQIRAINKAIDSREIVLFVPAPVDSWDGWDCHVPSETLKALLSCGVPVEPVGVDTLKTPDATRPVISFGNVVKPGAGALPAFWESILAANEAAFSSRRFLKGNLGVAVLRGLKLHSKAKVVDGLDGSELTYDKVLAAACALSRVVKKETQSERVGIVLPPGRASFIANIAVVLSGKKPVNLNFTAGRGAVESALSQAKLDRFITADPFVRKMQSFPWPPNRKLIFMERLMPQLKLKIAVWLALSKVLSPGMLVSILGVNRGHDRDEAGLLFTSGSSGDPKGVVLSHRNLLGNVQQFGRRLGLIRENDKIIGCLPHFHSFGFTVTIWFPVIHGIDMVTYPSPIEAPKIASLIEENAVTVLLATPTFLRGYLRKVNREQLATLRLVALGAEKLPVKLADTFREKFGKDVMEGYGLTETSPVTNLNLPDPEGRDGKRSMPSHKLGSVGHVMPGLALRVTDASTGGALPIDQQGIIWFKGPNVFDGYYNQPEKTKEVIDSEGWFCTGDLGRVDEDGFLYIEGRLSRFSKIGGEMVPHETLEAHINKVLGLEDESERKIAVVGIPDEAKGEALVLLSTAAGDDPIVAMADLRKKLLAEGVAALWIPKQIRDVGEIPILASGKLDLKGCETLALSAGTKERSSKGVGES